MVAKSKMFGVVLLQVFYLFVGFGSAFAAMELPEKLKEVPLYSGSTIVQVMDMGDSSVAMMNVKADREAFLGFYKKSMQAKGWKVAFQAEQEDNAMIHFTKDNQIIQLNVQKGEETGMLQYQLISAHQ